MDLQVKVITTHRKCQGTCSTSIPLSLSQICPHVQLKQTPTSYLLTINLSGFRREELKLERDTMRGLVVKGQRHVDGVGEVTWMWHIMNSSEPKAPFQIPSSVNLTAISATFHGGILRVMMPLNKVKGRNSRFSPYKLPSKTRQKNSSEEYNNGDDGSESVNEKEEETDMKRQRVTEETQDKCEHTFQKNEGPKVTSNHENGTQLEDDEEITNTCEEVKEDKSSLNEVKEDKSFLNEAKEDKSFLNEVKEGENKGIISCRESNGELKDKGTMNVAEEGQLGDEEKQEGNVGEFCVERKESSSSNQISEEEEDTLFEEKEHGYEWREYLSFEDVSMSMRRNPGAWMIGGAVFSVVALIACHRILRRR